MKSLDGITDAMDINLGKLWEMVAWYPWGHKELDMTGQLNDNNDYQRSPKSTT